jgi:hypothetical protein
MIPYCVACRRRHYGADCPDPPYYELSSEEHGVLQRALRASVTIRKRLKRNG